jgi:phosphoadenosine phosphosulfate reductase
MPHNLLSLSALVALSKEEQTAQLAEVNQQLEALSAQERVQ